MKKFYTLIIVSAFFSIPFVLAAQQVKDDIRCGTVELLKEQIKEHPSTLDTINKWNSLVNNWLAVHKDKDVNYRGVITIPVVIHLVYKPNSTDHVVSDWQVQSQIDVMNEDLRRLNADAIKTPSIFQPVAADCEFQFCLAQRDPNGNPTTGILREFSDSTGWPAVLSSLNPMKASAWPKEHYMNVWVCNLTGGYIGITVFPWDDSDTDGIVVADRAFGRIGSFLDVDYGLGRTLTHEFGHWVDGIHVWGDDGNDCTGTDYCGDTPNQGGYTSGCPDFPNWSGDQCSDTSNMFENYLDYSYDSCMNIYTLDQKARFIAAMNTYRSSILTCISCNIPSPYTYDLAVTNILYPAQTVNKRLISPQIVLANLGTNEITNCKIYYQFFLQKSRVYGDLHEYDWSGSLTAGQNINVSLPDILDSTGYSFLIVYAKMNGITEEDTVNNFSSRSYFVNPNAILPPVPGHVVAEYTVGSNIVTFQFDTLITSGFTMEVFNILGQPMKFITENTILNKVDIDLMEAPTGIYIARFRNGNTYLSSKFEFFPPQ